MRPPSPARAPDETSPLPESTLVSVQDEGLDQTTLLFDFMASSAVPPEESQPVLEPSLL